MENPGCYLALRVAAVCVFRVVLDEHFREMRG